MVLIVLGLSCEYESDYRIVLCCVALRCVALRCVALRCVALRCVALRCVALRCVALRCVALRCILLYCFSDVSFIGSPIGLEFVRRRNLMMNAFRIYAHNRPEQVNGVDVYPSYRLELNRFSMLVSGIEEPGFSHTSVITGETN